MTQAPLLTPLRNSARLRIGLIGAAFALPWCIALWLSLRHTHSIQFASGAVSAIVVLAAAALFFKLRHITTRWCIHQLNQTRKDVEDSADLLLQHSSLTPIQTLQRERLIQRLSKAPADLRPHWPLRKLIIGLCLAALSASIVLFWPNKATLVDLQAQHASASTPAGPIKLLRSSLSAHPPAYTHLPNIQSDALSIKTVQASQLYWQLHFSRQPKQAALKLFDGRRLPLQRKGEAWIASMPLMASTLYRIEIDGALLNTEKPWRLEASADQAPQIKVIQPEHSLTSASPTQQRWALAFEASDDFGLSRQATLHITHAQGSGENIQFQTRTLPLQGQGDLKRLRFTHTLNLPALGLQPGDDLIVQLEVEDNRRPQPQRVRSSSLILRVQTQQQAEAAGIEGAVKRVLPAYFRSQRQIILDAEALQKEKPKLAEHKFIERSDSIGVDQRILRLRYGQFLGEEASGAPKLPTADGDTDGDHEGEDHSDAHDHAQPSEPTVFGQESNLLESYGHTHDNAEATTLLDPETRATLKKALDQMWQSELHLRQGKPDQALPFAYKALGFIKQVQQASRIYLARVGPELPPIDETRRLTGKRDGLTSRPDMLQPATSANPSLALLWQRLGETTLSPLNAADLKALHEAAPRAEDPLALQAAIDVLQHQNNCLSCRSELRRLIWPLLSTPPASVTRRPTPSAQGLRYLDALQREKTP